ncbi:MAG TPA: flagellar basal-body MS-ring/collar protein FliF [Bacilli bacterium]
MNERLLQVWANVIQYWNQTNRTTKIIFFSTIAFIILSIILLTINFSKTEYSNAFTDLDVNDAAAIKEYLTSNSIPYKLSSDGKTIGVPSTMASEIKIDVESQGIMKNGSLGFGIFRDNLSSFGMTNDQFDLLKVDARAGEIQKLINSMSGVVRSQVLIFMPDESVFLNSDEKDKASASVVVTFKVGHPPAQEEIDAIFNLVSDSVPNLPLENITIADQNGELAPSSKEGGVESAINTIDKQAKIKKQFELDIQSKVLQMLGTILGRENVNVLVYSNLNFDKINSAEKSFAPVNTVDQKGIERSVEKISKSFSSEGGAAGGVPGTGESDVPTFPDSSGSGTTESEELSEKINYEVNEITKQVISSPYVVKDLTINVGIDPTGFTPEAITTIKDEVQRILMNIVNASLADSGQVALTDETLAKKVLVITQSFLGRNVVETGGILSNSLLYVLGGVALAIILGGAYLLFRRKQQAELVEEELTVQEKLMFPTVDIETANNDSQVRRQLDSLAKKKPDEFVNLLRTWLVDE